MTVSTSSATSASTRFTTSSPTGLSSSTSSRRRPTTSRRCPRAPTTPSRRTTAPIGDRISITFRRFPCRRRRARLAARLAWGPLDGSSRSGRRGLRSPRHRRPPCRPAAAAADYRGLARCRAKRRWNDDDGWSLRIWATDTVSGTVRRRQPDKYELSELSKPRSSRIYILTFTIHCR